ncbi:MAG TPA: hypothetical protein PKL28_14095 [Rhodocyclaceae bacterium]|jgi:hypothetical protein|nr:hypothetical protein [Rhodocyclaceae bacterium]HNE42069.1 hypothetical protein [Rhodocyclaceae bacterium]HNM21193.1 hypothetical protein [Rhodocyclaceae bacterium]HNM82183.1 hypothetical protein [Rhodocyclaceae bacterium]HNP04397.1 hypothetical protein [Rhodocyclaceae bacterium]
MFVQMSDDELIRQSELIVVGEWLGQSPLTVDGHRVDLGVVRVSEVLKGPSGTTVVLIPAASVDAPRSSSDLRYKRGDSGIWFLRPHPRIAGTFSAEHPQRFVSGPPARIDALRRLIGQARPAP